MPPENSTTDTYTYDSTGTTSYITTTTGASTSEIAPYVITTASEIAPYVITTTDWSWGGQKPVTLTKEELYEAIRSWNCDADGLIKSIQGFITPAQEVDIGDPVVVERQDEIVPPTSEELFDFLGI